MESLAVRKTFRSQLKNKNLRIRLFAVGIVIFVWQVGVSGLGKPFMATPLGILQAIPKTLLEDKKLWPGVYETFGVVFQGISISVLLGVILGLMMGRIPAISYAFAPYVNGFYATPMVAVLPLFTLWFGFNVSATLALVLFAAIPPMAVAAWDGTKALQVKYLEVAKSFGARRRDIWLGIAIPSSLPFLLAGFRLSSGRALSAVVIAEFLIGTGSGLGIHIMRLAQTFKHNEAIVALFILTFAGLFLAVGVESLVRRFLPWFRK